jgi:hypothetical protein
VQWASIRIEEAYDGMMNQVTSKGASPVSKFRRKGQRTGRGKRSRVEGGTKGMIEEGEEKAEEEQRSRGRE